MHKDSDFLTSSWPLPASGVRFITPTFLVELLQNHPLSEDCHPLAFGYYPQAAGHQMQRRQHPNHLLIYCVEGKGKLQIKQQAWTVSAGDLVLLPAGTAHAYQADADEPWSIYWVHYAGRLAADYSALLAMNEPVTAIGLDSGLMAGFDELLALRSAGYALLPFLYGGNLLKAMLSGLSVSISRTTQSSGTRMNLDALVSLMQRRLGTELSLDDLAREAQLSKYHFIRQFRQLTGHSPIQHFIHLKMQHACQLLDSSNTSVKRISAQVGYDDPYYFSRLFKRVIGVSPQQYRQSRLG